ncbi:MAG: TonB-dependent hemoglobin/transferrin/lactoferrin family receptor [Immundisolibacteraceae bacterium]|nr:TonB-dependent hemoglobin/transferrin/lactoferrin family receptor [Immundisolibacteraceae bacterium]
MRVPNPSWRTTLFATTMAFATSSGYAETLTTAPITTASIGLTNDEITQQFLPEVTITATRNPLKTFDYPGMVSVIGREAIDQSQSSSLDDLLHSVPNVEFTGGPRRTGEVPNIRGFSGPDVVITLDGARQNFGSAHDGRFFIDPSLLQEVEVLRGPASSLYGNGGMGGVIELRTVNAADLLKPEQTFGIDLAAGYQSVNNESSATVTAYGRPADSVQLLASVTSRNSDDIELGNGERLRPAEDDIVSALTKATFTLSPYHRVETSYLSFANDAREPNNGQGSGDEALANKKIRTETLRAAYHYANPHSHLPDIDLAFYRTESAVDERRLDNLGSGPLGEVLKRDVDTTGMRLDAHSEVYSSEHFNALLTYGGEIYTDEQDGAAGAGERDGAPDAESDFYGLFLQAELAFSDPTNTVPGSFLLIPGLRYDDYETKSDLGADNSDAELSPRFSVSYLPTEDSMLFASYTEAFRAPTFDELYLTGNHFVIPLGPGVNVINRFVPNSTLKPQRTATFEYGGGLTFNHLFQHGDYLQAKVSRFHIRGDDFIDLSVQQPLLFIDCNPFFPPGACDGTTRSTNVPDAKLWGSELELAYDSPRFRIRLGYSTIDGENDDTNEKLGMLTPDQITLDAALKFPQRHTTLGWRTLAATQFDKVNNLDEERDGYAVHDLYFSWQPDTQALHGLRVDLGVDNLFDKSYARVFTDASEPGRNFKARLSYSFF